MFEVSLGIQLGANGTRINFWLTWALMGSSWSVLVATWSQQCVSGLRWAYIGSHIDAI